MTWFKFAAFTGAANVQRIAATLRDSGIPVYVKGNDQVHFRLEAQDLKTAYNLACALPPFKGVETGYFLPHFRGEYRPGEQMEG